MQFLPLSLALLLSLGGTGLLHASWRDRVPRGLALSGAWLGLVAALVAWIVAYGAEFGTVLGLAVPGLFAWGFTLATMQQHQRKATRRQTANHSPLDGATGSSWLQHLLLFVLTVPVAGFCSAVICIAFADLLPFSELNRTVLSVFLTIFVWGCLAWWLCATQGLRVALLWLGLVTVLAAILLY